MNKLLSKIFACVVCLSISAISLHTDLPADILISANSLPTDIPTDTPIIANSVPTGIPTDKPISANSLPTDIPIDITQNANDYYVSTTGSDRNPGTIDRPWKSLQYAASHIIAGDTVYIRGGVYQATSSWDVNGTEGSPITITNYPGETVIIDGNHNTIPSAEYGVLLLIKGNWYNVSNLEISYSGYYGLLTKGNHITLDNIFCHHSYAAGITTSGSYTIVQNSKAWYNSIRHEFDVGDQWSTGISIMGSDGAIPQYSIIRHSIAWDNWGQGIKSALSSNSIVEDNIAYNNMYNYYIREARNTLFQRNLSFNTPSNLVGQYVNEVALLIGDEGETFPSRDNTFINNLIAGGETYNVSIGSNTFEGGLFANNTIANAIGSYGVRIGRGAYSNARFENNIVLQEGSIPIGINLSTGITFGYNNWSKRPPGNMRGTNDIVSNPLLAETGALYTPDWFKLTSSSPASDHALYLPEVTEDYWQNLRGNPPDMGAHEYQ